MANLNRVFLIGNLCRDPELRYTPDGTAVTTLGLAVNQKFKQGDEWKDDVTFIDVTAWKKTAENCVEYLSKGSPVMVEGRLKYHTWEKDGQKRSKIDVTAIAVQFLGSKDTRSEGQPPQDDESTVPF